MRKNFGRSAVPKHPKLPKNLPILEQIEYKYSKKLPLRALNGRKMATLAVKKREKQGKKTASIAAFLAGLNRREEQGKNQEIKIQSPTAVSLTSQGLQLLMIRLRGMRQGRASRPLPLPKKLAHMTPKSFDKFLGIPWM